MHRLVSSIAVALVALVSLAGSMTAQGADPSSRSQRSATDSVYQRARRLVSEGNGATGRAIVDSMLRAATEETPAYGDALFWRGALAETAADAERDYRRVIVEYPLSAYADDALLSLAELEQARGNRLAAFQHLQRFVREHPVGPARARAGLAAARLAFEQRDLKGGCAMIADARSSVGSTDVELRNQIDYQGTRCPSVTAAAPAAATMPAPSTSAPSVRSSGSPTPVAPPPTRSPSGTKPVGPSSTSATPIEGPSSHADSSAMRSTAAPPARSAPAVTAPPPKEPVAKAPVATSAAPRGIWTIQLAAYNTRSDADALVRKLAARGVKARISGDAKPFRVRLEYYDTRQEAAARVAELKQRGIIGFVTDEPRSTGVTRP